MALYLDFEDAKNIHDLEVLIWGFGRRWRFLTGVWHLDLNMNMVRILTWIFPKVLITLRSVEAQIQLVWNQIILELLKLFWVWSGLAWFWFGPKLKIGITQLRLS